MRIEAGRDWCQQERLDGSFAWESKSPPGEHVCPNILVARDVFNNVVEGAGLEFSTHELACGTVSHPRITTVSIVDVFEIGMIGKDFHSMSSDEIVKTANGRTYDSESFFLRRTPVVR